MSYIPSFAEEGCMTRHNQDDTRISAYYSTRITQRIESCNYLSRTGVEVHRRTI